MPLEYVSPNPGRLQQGEVIANLEEFQVVSGTSAGEVSYLRRSHPYVVVMSADCDLLHDFEHRRALAQQGLAQGTDDNPRLLPHVILCEAYPEEDIRGSVHGSDLWKRIKQNQDERYHRLSAAVVGNPPVRDLPDLYLDFKKTWSAPTEYLEGSLAGRMEMRLAVVPPVYLHDLMHRLFNFLGRVALPEP